MNNDEIFSKVKEICQRVTWENYLDMLEVCEERREEKFRALLEKEEYGELAKLMCDCKRNDKFGL